MKMHEKLSAGQPEPRNRANCKLRVSYNEESDDPVQLWFASAARQQGVFMTEHEAKVLYYRLGCILLEKE